MRRLTLLFYIVVACVAGTATVLAFAPVNFYSVAPLTLAVLFYVAAKAEKALHVFGIGMAFGFAFFVSGLWWLFQALSGYIGLPVVGAVPVMILFCLFLALFPATALLIGRLVSRDKTLALFAYAAAWVLTEWLRGFLFTGFPWLTIGYSQIPDGWLSAWGPLSGIYGVSFMVTLTAACLASVFTLGGKRRLIGVVIPPLLLIVPMVVNSWLWISPTSVVKISLLQGNVKQALKWQPGQVEQALADYLAMAKGSAGRIIIMPETALPMRLEDLPDNYAKDLQKIAAHRYGAVITGMFVQDGDTLYNAAVALEENRISDYRKHHLTPYGEYLPFSKLLKPLLDEAGIPYNSLGIGADNQPLILSDGIYAGVSICYEDAFGDEWRAQLPTAQLLVNLTNDGWFDGSVMAKQHLQISQARALELGRWLVRATNTGETAVINQDGFIVSSLPPNIQGVLTEDVQLYRGATLFVLIGNWGAVGAALLLLLALVGYQLIVGISRKLKNRRAR